MALFSIPLKWLLTGAGATTIGAVGLGSWLFTTNENKDLSSQHDSSGNHAETQSTESSHTRNLADRSQGFGVNPPQGFSMDSGAGSILGGMRGEMRGRQAQLQSEARDKLLHSSG